MTEKLTRLTEQFIDLEMPTVEKKESQSNISGIFLTTCV
jgi:hypothetical protein